MGSGRTDEDCPLNAVRHAFCDVSPACPRTIAGLGIDIWHGAGAPACSSKRFRSLHPSDRAANCDRRPSTPDRRLWIVESDFRTSGSMPRVDRTNATDVPFCAAARMATAVVLARYSAPGRVWSIAGSRTVNGAHGFDYRVRIGVLCGQSWRSPCLLELHAPRTAPRGVWTSLRWYLPSVPRRAVDARLTNLLSLLTGVALVVAAVAEVARDHNSFRWVWTGIGIAGLFIVVVSLIQRRRIGREAK
jgi:hypothetical protein